MSIDCFVTKDGAERKAELEDLFPVLGKDRRALQYILREANRLRIDLAGVLAYLPNAMKEMVYDNVSHWISGRLRKQVDHAEATFGKNYAHYKKEELIELIGKRERTRHICLEYPEYIVWKEAGSYKIKIEELSTTDNSSVPDFISQDKNSTDDIDDIDNTDDALTELVLIPEEQSVSYRYFCISYYWLVSNILRLNEKAWNYGLLSLEEELYHFSDGFFRQGLRLVVNGTDAEIIRHILTTRLEREHDHYKKKLMEVAMEGILCIQAGDLELPLAMLLASLVDIKGNLLEAACAKYLAGDINAFSNIDYDAVIKPPEDEREELCFIKRAVNLAEIARKEGIFALEEHLDHEGIAGRDVFEYGLVFVVDGWDFALMEKVLDNLIEREADPVQKNLSKAKKDAVMAIGRGESPRVLCEILCAYFDESITGEAGKLCDWP